jgi:hypothetical protein
MEVKITYEDYLEHPCFRGYLNSSIHRLTPLELIKQGKARGVAAGSENTRQRSGSKSVKNEPLSKT